MTDIAQQEPASPAPSPKPAAGRRRSAVGELPVLLGVALIIALVVKAFLVQAFYIPSGSMEPTLKVGDRVLVDKVSYRLGDIKRGDIVVFNGVDSFSPEVTVTEPTNPLARLLRGVGRVLGIAPPSERDFVKRVIGVGGDHVKCCDSRGRVVVNNHALDEPYVMPGDAPSDENFDTVVPSGKLWVMGDHRSSSADSRAHKDEAGGGFVPVDKVIGKAIVVIWPFGHDRTLGTPGTFHQTGLDVVVLLPLAAVRRRRGDPLLEQPRR